MVFEKKQLSKVLAVFMIVACALAFMPLLNGQAFAAAKKPGKVTVKSVKQVSGTYNVKVTWKKATNAKKYNVKVGSKTYKNKKGTSLTVKNLAAGTYKVKVQGVNGKKKGAWSKAKKVAVADIAAAAVTITGSANVGAVLTANVTNAAGEALTEGVAYQWYRVNTLTGVVAEISGAKDATYAIVAADYEYTLFVKATAGGKTVQSAPTTEVTNIRALAGVSIVLPNGHEAPQLGDTLKLDVRDSVGDAVESNVTYQWFVGGKKVAGEAGTKATLAIPAGEDTYKAYLGKSVTVTVTAVEDKGYTGEVSSLATLPIIKSTTPEGVDIETSAAAPFVGETIKAVFTPEGTSDAEATYQWYRVKNGKAAAIAGATAAEYTVTASDKDSQLKVEVTLSTGAEFASSLSENVQEPLVGAKATVASTHTEGERDKPVPNVYTTSDDAVVTVEDKDGVTINDDNFTYAWYLDSVADENQLFSGAYDAAAAAADPNYKQPTAGGTGVYATNAKKLDLGKTYYLARSTTPLESLVGHKVVAVAATKATYDYQGSVTTEPTAAIQIQLAGNVDLNGDTDDKYIAGKTTLTATFTAANLDDADATVSFTWYKYDYYDAKYVVIEGATDSTYAIPAADIGNKAYKVEVKGTGDYYGTLTGEIVNINVEKNEGQEVSVFPVLTGGTAGSGDYDAFVQAGDVLTASANVATAEPYMTYTWSYVASTGVDPVETKGTTFTVPADAKAGAEITLTATSSVTDYKVSGTPKAKVKTALKSVTLSSTATWGASSVTAGHDGVAYPNVGETLSAVVDPEAASTNDLDYQWYADGEKIKDKTGASLQLSADEFGKTITVEVKGKNSSDYAGSKVTSNASGVVGAIGKLNVKMNGVVLGNNSVVGVGNTLVPILTAYIYDGTQKKLVESDVSGLEDLAQFTWAVGEKTAEEAVYTVMADDAGNTWTCTASGIEAAAEGALTWGNGLEIVGETQPTEVIVDLVHEDNPYGRDDRPNVIIKTMDGVDVTEAALDTVTWQYYRTQGGWNHTFTGTFSNAIQGYSARNVRAVVGLNDGFVSDSLSSTGVVNTAIYEGSGNWNSSTWTYTPEN